MSTTVRRERVWDPFIRIFHWSLVSCVLLNQWVLEEGDPPHRWAGYVAAALIGLRVLWGFVGTRHARFASFWPTPSRVRTHLSSLFAGQAAATAGHNPLGALMMLALMALVLALGLTGWLMGTDLFWGNEALEELHEGLAATVLWLAALHAAAAVLMGRRERTRLIKAMFTGVKEHY